MRPVLLTVLAAVLFDVGGAGAQEPPARRRPNILFLMTDQQRWDSLGANGNRLVKTPNFDRLASAGANFTHAFVQAPVCVPSRVSFFTGRYPHAHRNRVNYTPFDPSETLLQARLKAAGYATASVGKLHYTPPTPEAGREGRRSRDRDRHEGSVAAVADDSFGDRPDRPPMDPSGKGTEEVKTCGVPRGSGKTPRLGRVRNAQSSPAGSACRLLHP